MYKTKVRDFEFQGQHSVGRQKKMGKLKVDKG